MSVLKPSKRPLPGHTSLRYYRPTALLIVHDYKRRGCLSYFFKPLLRDFPYCSHTWCERLKALLALLMTERTELTIIAIIIIVGQTILRSTVVLTVQ